MASKLAYEMAGITHPMKELDFIELHDAYTSSEIQTYEDMGLCKYGEAADGLRRGTHFSRTSTTAWRSRSRGRFPSTPLEV